MNKFDQDELLADVAASLRQIAIAEREIADGIAIARKRDELRYEQRSTVRPIRYMSGRWPVRNGDTYGIVEKQPPIQDPSPEPPVHADDPTGHL